MYPVILCLQNSVPSIRITSLYGFQSSSVVLACKTAPFGPESQVSMGPRHHLSFCASNTVWLVPELLVSMTPALMCGFGMQNSHFWTRITSLYGSQTSPVVLCMQNSVIRTRNTSLYGSQPTSVVFACKTATFGQELHVSIGPKHHLSFCVCTTVWLVPELLVSMGPSPNLSFLHAKSDFWTRIASRYWYQTSPVVLFMQNRVISNRITGLYGFQPSSAVLYIQKNGFRTNIACLYGSQTYPVILCLQKQRA